MSEPANPNAQPTGAPTNKTLAATGGSAVGAAIATIILYFIQQHSATPIPETVTSATTIVISTVVTFIAGYFTPHSANEGVVRDANGRVVSAR